MLIHVARRSLGCSARWAVLGVWFLAVCGALACARPHRTRAISALSALCYLLLAAISFVGASEAAKGASTASSATAKAALVVAVLVLSVVRTLCDGVMFFCVEPRRRALLLATVAGGDLVPGDTFAVASEVADVGEDGAKNQHALADLGTDKYVANKWGADSISSDDANDALVPSTRPLSGSKDRPAPAHALGAGIACGRPDKEDGTEELVAFVDDAAYCAASIDCDKSAERSAAGTPRDAVVLMQGDGNEYSDADVATAKTEQHQRRLSHSTGGKTSLDTSSSDCDTDADVEAVEVSGSALEVADAAPARFPPLLPPAPLIAADAGGDTWPSDVDDAESDHDQRQENVGFEEDALY